MSYISFKGLKITPSNGNRVEEYKKKIRDSRKQKDNIPLSFYVAILERNF